MRKILLTTLVIIAMASVAGADVLWDQSDYNAEGPGFFNGEGGQPPFGMTMYTVSDIVVDEPWNVSTITTHWSILDVNWANFTEGYLHVWPKTGPLPEATDIPTDSAIVPMSGSVDMNIGVAVADGIDLMLEPGEYWIGITPFAPAGPFGLEVQFSSSTLIGDWSPSYDPNGMPMAGWLNFTMEADATILIEGNVTVATESKSLSDVKALFE